ncbi:DUF4352 domain-containing protein [Actinocorallia libanotica]|uniref:DUF4352 domain-containing protein n=1 Tax=Actinocorallia libanotica TaxID=46162 RepID=A0ABP4BKF0_9ACTN
MHPSLRVLPVALACLLVTACEAAETTSAPPGEGERSAQVRREEKPAPKVAGIGARVKDGKFTFKVTKAGNGPATLGDSFLSHSPQGRFYLVYVTVKNHGNKPQYFLGDAQKLLAGEKEFSADGEAAIYLKDSKSLFEEINPGNTVKGVIVYDIPKKAKPTAIELHDSVLSGGATVSLAK